MARQLRRLESCAIGSRRPCQHIPALDFGRHLSSLSFRGVPTSSRHLAMSPRLGLRGSSGDIAHKRHESR